MKLVRLGMKEFAGKVNDFYNKSMFTFEGLNYDDEPGMQKLEEHIRVRGYNKKEFVAYCFTGDMMNEHFGLTDSNAYADDLKFIVIPDFYDPVYKMTIGARWFDDIVSNNTIRQNAINHHTEEDYGCEEAEDYEDDEE